jgi:hypothetical protein
VNKIFGNQIIRLESTKMIPATYIFRGSYYRRVNFNPISAVNKYLWCSGKRDIRLIVLLISLVKVFDSWYDCIDLRTPIIRPNRVNVIFIFRFWNIFFGFDFDLRFLFKVINWLRNEFYPNIPYHLQFWFWYQVLSSKYYRRCLLRKWLPEARYGQYPQW